MVSTVPTPRKPEARHLLLGSLHRRDGAGGVVHDEVVTDESLVPGSLLAREWSVTITRRTRRRCFLVLSDIAKLLSDGISIPEPVSSQQYTGTVPSEPSLERVGACL